MILYQDFKDSESIAQIQAQQHYLSTLSSDPCYLTPGAYILRTQSDAYDKVLLPIQLDESGEMFKVEMNLREFMPKGEGWIRSYMVSDTFLLRLSDRFGNSEEMYYGFNIDFLAHLGGEAHFKAKHLQSHHTLERDKAITWRLQHMENNEWMLNFKSPLLFPGRQVNYKAV
jgi:hypothetical protein